MKALNEKSIAKLKDEGRYRDKDSVGLYLQVGKNGNKSWLLRFELNHRERFMGLGSLKDFSLKEARQRARERRQLLADGIDPIEHRNALQTVAAHEAKKNAQVPTFKSAAERYFSVHGSKWSSAKHRQQFVRSLKDYAYPTLGNLPVNTITTEDVRRTVEPIWHKIYQTASRTRGKIENVLSWSIANGYRDGPNPARWGDNLEFLLPDKSQAAKKSTHHAALPYDELPGFWATLNNVEGVAPRALEFIILTAVRASEATLAIWSEIDFKEKVWTIPADRMKSKRPHRVPLSEQALAILKALPREDGNPFVFLGSVKGKSVSSASVLNYLQKLRDDATVHGMRSSFRDWAFERTNFPREVAEVALAHVVGDATERAYRRGDVLDKRRKLMTAWAKFVITKPVASSNNVVAIRA